MGNAGTVPGSQFVAPEDVVPSLLDSTTFKWFGSNAMTAVWAIFSLIFGTLVAILNYYLLEFWISLFKVIVDTNPPATT